MLTLSRSGWSSQNWDFGSGADYPRLRSYSVGVDGGQVPGELLRGQPLPAPVYTLRSATASSFTLSGTVVPFGVVRHFFVHTSPLSLSDVLPSEGNGFSSEIEFEISGDGASGGFVVVGEGGEGGSQELVPNTRYYVRSYDYRASDGALSAVSLEVVVRTSAAERPDPVVVAPSFPAPVYALISTTKTSFTLSGEAVPDGMVRRFFVHTSPLSSPDMMSSEAMIKFDISGDGTSGSVVVVGEDGEGGQELVANTQYYVRAYDYRLSDRVFSEVSSELMVRTSAEEKPDPAVIQSSGPLRGAILAYPNPTSGLLHLPVWAGSVLVFSSDGVEVGSFEISARRMDLSELPTGAYVIRLSEHVFRVVKE